MKRFYLLSLSILLSLLTGANFKGFAQATTFHYTGGVQTYLVPTAITSISVDMSGGCGGFAYINSGTNPITLGGRTQAVISVTPGQTLYVYVGGAGPNWTSSIEASGGWNGGGGGGSFAAGGGGATDIRSSTTGYSSANMIAVAGGGGGGGDFSEAGGLGGGLTAGSGTGGACGGAQTGPACSTGYGLGTAGSGNTGGQYSIGGGGGGWYGGNSGVYTDGGAGGGSCYQNPTYVTSYTMTQGYANANGNGIAIIIPLCSPPVAGTIVGTTAACIGQSTTQTDVGGSTDGVWISSNPSIATVGSLTGIVTGISSGTDTVTYSINHGTCGTKTPSVTISVNPPPAPITGSTSICSAFPSTLSTISTGGAWSSSNTAIATVNSVTGVVTGVSQGFPVISYTFPTMCSSTITVSVNVSPNLYTVSGGGPYCMGNPAPHVLLSNSDILVNYQLITGGSVVATLAGTGRYLDFGATPVGGVYTINAVNTNGGCSLSMSGSATITVNSLPPVHNITASSNSYCAGGTGVTLGLNGSEAGVSYQLLAGTGAYGAPFVGTGSSFTFPFGATTMATYTIMATNGFGCNSVMTGSEAVTINPAPNIYAVSGGGSYCAGGSGVPVYVAGSDPGVSYQLSAGGSFYGGSETGGGGMITFSGVTPAGFYSVIGTSSSGCSSIMSGIASVAIIPLPEVETISAEAGGGFCSGGVGRHIYLSYSVSGISYQLYNSGGMVGLPVTGVDASLDFGLQNIPSSYYITATNEVSHCIDNMAGSAVISILPLPLQYNMQPGGPYCSGGAGVPVKLGNSDAGTIYQLYDNGVYTGISDTALTGGLINFGLQTAGGGYTVLATNPVNGCMNNMLDTATVVVNPLPTPYVVTGGGGYCAGGAGMHIYLSTSDGGISYQLYSGMSALGSAMMGSGSMLDFGLDTSGSYTVSGTNTATGCVGSMSGSVSITVNPLPQVFNVTGGGPYCAGGTGSLVGVSFSNPGIQYQLRLASVPVGLPLTGSSGALSFGSQTTTGVYTISAENTTTGCTANMSGNATVSTTPSPVVYTVTGGGGYCAGSSGRPIGLSASNIGVTYQLYNETALIGTLSGTGYALNFGSQVDSGIYTVVASNGSTGCNANMSSTAVIYPNALPLVQTVTGGGGYCAGGTGVGVGLTSSEPGVNYQLYYDGSSIGAPLPGGGASIGFGLQTLAGTYTVVAKNAATFCASNMAASADVIINPLPTNYTVTGGGNFCAGGTGVSVGLDGSNIGLTYQLSSSSGSPVTMPGTGGLLNYGLETVPGVYTISATNTTTGCSAPMAGSVMVIVNPLPVAYSLTGGGSYCADSAAPDISLSSSDAGMHYMLYNGVALIGSYSVGSGSSIDFGTIATSGIYNVTAVNPATGCSADMTGTATVDRVPLVTPFVSIASGSGTTICSGTSVTFTATPVNGGSTPTYQWWVGTTPAGTGGSTYTYTPTNGDMVTAMLTSSAACPSGPSTSDAITMTVNATVPTAVSTGIIKDSVCQGSTAFFYAIPVEGGLTPNYTWYKNGVEEQTGPGLTYSMLPENTDNVYVTMRSSVPCPSNDSSTGNNVMMYVQQPLTPSVTLSASPNTPIAPGTSVTFTATATNTTITMPVYQWDINGNVVAGVTGTTFTSANLSDGDVVTCTVSNEDLCGTHSGSASKTERVLPEGVQQINSGISDIMVTPNPSNGSFILKGSLGTTEDVELSVEITNILGQAVYTGKVMAPGGKINSHIQLNSVANGMYMLNLHSDAGNAAFHIVIEN